MTLQETVAFELHEAWRRPRALGDGTYEPRWKKIKDENYVARFGGKLPAYVRVTETGEYEIDIANACYSQLSSDWQAENKAAAEVVAKIIESGKQLTEAEVGEIIHSAWLERNSWAKDGELGVPFAELPVEEQEKDLVQYRIAKQMAEATEYTAWVGDLDRAVNVLNWTKATGENIYIDFNGQRLYSLFDTPDTAYLKVTGYTRAGFKQAEEEWHKAYEAREAREKAEAEKNIPVWYERGKKVVYPEKWDKWHECVEGRAHDLYHGFDLVNALEIMEALDEGKSIEEASEIFNNAGHSGSSAAMVLKIVVNFSARGTEFFRANYLHEITPETEGFLQQIDADNARYAREAQERAKNGGKKPV